MPAAALPPPPPPPLPSTLPRAATANAYRRRLRLPLHVGIGSLGFLAAWGQRARPYTELRQQPWRQERRQLQLDSFM